MSYITPDRASDLIEALKDDQENFILSNLHFKNHSALKAVGEFYRLESELLEFAKDPDKGLELLGPEPRRPTNEELSSMTDDEKRRALQEYAMMMRMYEERRQALEMHVPHEDLIMIKKFLKPYEKMIHATPAVKGLRFKAFTKDVEHEEQGMLKGLFKGNRQAM